VGNAPPSLPTPGASISTERFYNGHHTVTEDVRLTLIAHRGCRLSLSRGEGLPYPGPTGREEPDVAELQLDGSELVLHLSGAEKAEAVHGDLRVPLSALRGVEVLDDAHAWTGIGVGFKVGMRVPGVATVASVRGHGEKVFIAVHGDTPRGVRVRLEGAPWDEWIVGCADPEAVAATLPSAG
jgi:hypothetical protein